MPPKKKRERKDGAPSGEQVVKRSKVEPDDSSSRPPPPSTLSSAKISEALKTSIREVLSASVKAPGGPVVFNHGLDVKTDASVKKDDASVQSSGSRASIGTVIGIESSDKKFVTYYDMAQSALPSSGKLDPNRIPLDRVQFKTVAHMSSTLPTFVQWSMPENIVRYIESRPNKTTNEQFDTVIRSCPDAAVVTVCTELEIHSLTPEQQDALLAMTINERDGFLITLVFTGLDCYRPVTGHWRFRGLFGCFRMLLVVQLVKIS